MAKKKQGHSQGQESQCLKKMRMLKFRLKDSTNLKNNNPPAASPRMSPSMSPAAVSSMRVSVTELDNPTTEWRRRKKRLRFSQFLEVRSWISQTLIFNFITSRSRCLQNTTGKPVSPGQSWLPCKRSPLRGSLMSELSHIHASVFLLHLIILQV